MKLYGTVAAVFALAACSSDDHVYEPFVPPPGPESCLPGDIVLEHAVDIAHDADFVYIADQRGSGGAVVRVDKDCVSSEVIAEVSEQLYAVAVDEGDLYWVTRAALWRLAAGAETPSSIAVLDDVGYGDLALDDAHVYLALGDSLGRVSKQGGAVEELATFNCAAGSVALDASHAYVAQSGCAGDIVRVDKATGGLERIFAAQHSDSIVVDDTDAYWVRHEHGSLTRWPKTGGEANIIGYTVHTPGKLAIDDTRVFAAEKSNVGSYMKGNSESWLGRAEAIDVAVDTDHVWALDRGALARVPRPADEEVTGFATGDAAATFEWIIDGGQSCTSPEAEMVLLLLGPSSRNAMARCDDYSYSFEHLAAGDYVMQVEFHSRSVGFKSDPFSLASSQHYVIGPLDMGSL